jgi:NTP pyrophosphatase (non-canonical NTP hydrolase)
MDFQTMVNRAIEIRQKYDDLNDRNDRDQWNATDFMAGFVGDVGDLSKIIMAKNGLRDMDNIDESLAHELSDCLWSLFIISDKYKIDLANSFLKTMDDLEMRINMGLDDKSKDKT